jgi:hypothetical protein
MKKTLVIMLVLGMGLSGLFAQDLELGGDVGMVLNPKWKTTLLMGFKATYPVLGPWAATLQFNYVLDPIKQPVWAEGFSSSVWSLDAGARYQFSLANSVLIPYALAAVGLFRLMQSFDYDFGKESWGKSKIAFALGVGLIVPIIARLALDFSFRYKVINGLVGDMFVFTIGLIFYLSLTGR